LLAPLLFPPDDIERNARADSPAELTINLRRTRKRPDPVGPFVLERTVARADKNLKKMAATGSAREREGNQSPSLSAFPSLLPRSINYRAIANRSLLPAARFKSSREEGDFNARLTVKRH